jgi:hypothetical protein
VIARADDTQGEKIAVERIQKLWKPFHVNSAQPEVLEFTMYKFGRSFFFLISIDSSSIETLPLAISRTPANAFSTQVRLQMVSWLAKYKSLCLLLDIGACDPKG